MATTLNPALLYQTIIVVYARDLMESARVSANLTDADMYKPLNEASTEDIAALSRGLFNAAATSRTCDDFLRALTVEEAVLLSDPLGETMRKICALNADKWHANHARDEKGYLVSETIFPTANHKYLE